VSLHKIVLRVPITQELLNLFITSDHYFTQFPGLKKELAEETPWLLVQLKLVFNSDGHSFKSLKFFLHDKLISIERSYTHITPNYNVILRRNYYNCPLQANQIRKLCKKSPEDLGIIIIATWLMRGECKLKLRLVNFWIVKEIIYCIGFLLQRKFCTRDRI